MTLPSALLAFVVVLAIGAAPHASPAQDSNETLRRCVNFRDYKDSVDAVIGYCTAALQSGRLTNEWLSWAHAVRGHMRSLAGSRSSGIGDLTSAIRYDPGLQWAGPWALLRRADAYILDQPELSLRDLNTFLAAKPRDVEGLLDRAEVYQHLRQPQNALTDLTEVIRLEPQNAYAYSQRAYVRYRELKDEGGFADWERAYALNRSVLQGDYADALIDRGHARLDEGRAEGAVADFTLAMGDSYFQFHALAGRSAAYRQLGRYALALADAQALVDREPNSPEALLQRGLTRVALQQPAAAVADLDRVLKVEPRHAVALYARGVARQSLETEGAAEADLKAASAIDARVGRSLMLQGISPVHRPESPVPGYVKRGQEALQARNYKLAVDQFTQALAWNSKAPAVLAERAEAYVGLQDYVRAIADLSAAIDLGNATAEIFYRRGYLYAMGILPPNGPGPQKERAIADYSAAIVRDPSHTRARSQRGWEMEISGDLTRALEDYAAVVSLTYARKALARVLGRVGRAAEAMDHLTRAVALDPNDDNLHEALGTAAIQAGQFSRALDEFGLLLTRNSNHHRAWAGRCLARAGLGQLQQALDDCNRGLAAFRAVQNRDDPGILESRGIVYFRLGRLDAALVDLDAAVSAWAYGGAPAALFTRGVLKSRRGDSQGAAADIQRAQQAVPAIAQQMSALGVSR
jgi:tetratricopeptide (TPR) repeat protein